jgi:AAA family ATP:ADP antiporter
MGSIFLASWIDRFDVRHWMEICIGLVILIAGVSVLAGRLYRNLPPESRSRDTDADVDEEDEKEAPSAADTALQGIRLALRSRYLLSVIAIVGVYELASTLMDFQFTSAVEHFLDGEAIGVHFSRVYAITNSVSLLVQLFLTSLVMTRLGVGAALLVLPLAVLGSSTSFLLLPTLWTGSLLSIADNSLAYSIHQSSKESLYVPTSPAEKYQAKAFIDMWVQRFAKAVAVVASLGITLVFSHFGTVRWLSLLTLALLLLWIPAVRYAGKRFERYEEEPHA